MTSGSGEVTFEITKTDDHPRMANIELGGGAVRAHAREDPDLASLQGRG